MRLIRKRIAQWQHEHIPSDPDPVEHVSLEDHHHVSGDRRQPYDLFNFSHTYADDPAASVSSCFLYAQQLDD